MSVIFEAECQADNCVCTFKDEDFDGFRFSEELHRFVATCDDCGEFMTTLYNGVLECSAFPVSHIKLMLFAEDYPPFFDSEDEF